MTVSALGVALIFPAISFQCETSIRNRPGNEELLLILKMHDLHGLSQTCPLGVHIGVHMVSKMSQNHPN